MAGKLNAARMRTLVQPGTYGDGGGLYLQVRGPDKRSWLFRYKLAGRARLMGLGPAADVSLHDAREEAQRCRKLVRQGVDPIDHRRADKAMAAGGLRSFRQVAEAYMAGQAAGWRNAKHRQQWANTLSAYTYPVIGDLPVSAIGTGEVTRVLTPIWATKPETASRVRGRIEAVLDYASAHGWRTGENPARWRGHLAKVLPARGKVRQVKHHAALPWRDLAAFMVDLARQPGMAAKALQFVILTAARTGEAIGATWGEVDLAEAVWTVPAPRMKAGREHRVPLSGTALALLGELHAVRLSDDPGAFVFPGARLGQGLSNMAMTMVLRRMQRGDLTAHGFRSSFRDWASEATGFPGDVAEAALAHTIGDKVEAAYRRGDLFEKRRAMMAAWAEHCTRPAPAPGMVVPIRRRASR